MEYKLHWNSTTFIAAASQDNADLQSKTVLQPIGRGESAQAQAEMKTTDSKRKKTRNISDKVTSRHASMLHHTLSRRVFSP